MGGRNIRSYMAFFLSHSDAEARFQKSGRIRLLGLFAGGVSSGPLARRGRSILQRKNDHSYLAYGSLCAHLACSSFKRRRAQCSQQFRFVQNYIYALLLAFSQWSRNCNGLRELHQPWHDLFCCRRMDLVGSSFSKWHESQVRHDSNRSYSNNPILPNSFNSVAHIPCRLGLGAENPSLHRP